MTALLVIAATTLAVAGCRKSGNDTRTPSPTPTVSATASAAPTTVALALSEAASIPVPTNARLAWATDGRILAFGESELVSTDANLGSSKRFTAPAGTRILAASPDGHTLALANLNTGGLLLWDTPDLAPRGIEGGSGRTSAGFTGDGTSIIVADQSAVTASIFDVRTGAKTGTLTGFQTAAPVFNFIVGPTDVGAWHARATVQFALIPSGTLGARLSFEDFVGNASFTRDGKLLLTTTGIQEGGKLVERLQAWDPASGTERFRVTLPDLGSHATLSPDGTQIAVAGTSGARILDRSGAVLWVDAKHGAATSAEFTTDGRALLVISDGALRRYDIAR